MLAYYFQISLSYQLVHTLACHTPQANCWDQKGKFAKPFIKKNYKAVYCEVTEPFPLQLQMLSLKNDDNTK